MRLFNSNIILGFAQDSENYDAGCLVSMYVFYGIVYLDALLIEY